jgi:ATP-dependent DNA helicase Q1
MISQLHIYLQAHLSRYFLGEFKEQLVQSSLEPFRPVSPDILHRVLNYYSFSDFPWNKKVKSAMKDVFHIDKFRPLQEKTINTTMSGKDCILIMPTGGGKSLCFQLPAVASDGEYTCMYL